VKTHRISTLSKLTAASSGEPIVEGRREKEGETTHFRYLDKPHRNLKISENLRSL
jgi:hypothetical protein